MGDSCLKNGGRHGFYHKVMVLLWQGVCHYLWSVHLGDIHSIALNQCSLQIERKVKIFSANEIVVKLCFQIIYELKCPKIAV